MSKSASQSGLEAGAPRRAVQLCYWQIGAGQRAAGLSRPWHIKAPDPIASPPVAPQPATSKDFWAHRRFPSKGLDAALTHASQPAKEIWLKAHYWGKEGGQRRGLVGTEWREKKTGYQAEGIILYLSHIFSLSLSFFISFPKQCSSCQFLRRSEQKDDRTWHHCSAAPLSHNLFLFQMLALFLPFSPLPLYPLLPLEVTSQVI